MPVLNMGNPMDKIETPTPRTDAVSLEEREGITHPDLCETYMAYTDYWALRELCRTLERELAASQRDAQAALDRGDSYMRDCTRLTAEIASITKEVEALGLKYYAGAYHNDRAQKAEREIKRLDPDPVVCGCREALCPHTPIAQLPRQALVDHFKARIKSIEADAEAKLEKAERERDGEQMAAATMNGYLLNLGLERDDYGLWQNKRARDAETKLATQSQANSRVVEPKGVYVPVARIKELLTGLREDLSYHGTSRMIVLCDAVLAALPSVEETNKAQG